MRQGSPLPAVLTATCVSLQSQLDNDNTQCWQYSFCLLAISRPLGKETFIIDPYFPSRLKKAGYYRCLEFIQFLLDEYSKWELTYKSDRDTAIRSLLERMSRELATDVKYGIARCFIGSLLLWKRTAKDMTLPINFERRTVPSWSWMAYDGSIEFIDKFRYDLRIPQSTDLGVAPKTGKSLSSRSENSKIAAWERIRETMSMLSRLPTVQLRR